MPPISENKHLLPSSGVKVEVFSGKSIQRMRSAILFHDKSEVEVVVSDLRVPPPSRDVGPRSETFLKGL